MVRDDRYEPSLDSHLNNGLKVFHENGEKAAKKELDQLVRRHCWQPMDVKDMTPEERRKEQNAMMLLTEKSSGEVKGRRVYKGNGTRDWLSKEDTASPTVSLEGIMNTCLNDAYEGRDVMSADVPNAFIQTWMPETKEGEARVMMKITGLLVC